MGTGSKLTILIWLVLLFCTGCKKASVDGAPEKVHDVRIAPNISNEAEAPVVTFSMQEIPDTTPDAATRRFNCDFVARGRHARFQLELSEGKSIPGDVEVTMARGRFVAVQGSDSQSLLEDLKTALDAKNLPGKVKRVRELPFDAVILGKNQSRSKDGAFASEPKGDWTAMKLFLPKDGDDGEVFLNIDRVAGKGEFSIKDSDYGDYVLAQLAKVL